MENSCKHAKTKRSLVKNSTVNVLRTTPENDIVVHKKHTEVDEQKELMAPKIK